MCLQMMFLELTTSAFYKQSLRQSPGTLLEVTAKMSDFPRGEQDREGNAVLATAVGGAWEAFLSCPQRNMTKETLY